MKRSEIHPGQLYVESEYSVRPLIPLSMEVFSQPLNVFSYKPTTITRHTGARGNGGRIGLMFLSADAADSVSSEELAALLINLARSFDIDAFIAGDPRQKAAFSVVASNGTTINLTVGMLAPAAIKFRYENYVAMKLAQAEAKAAAEQRRVTSAAELRAVIGNDTDFNKLYLDSKNRVSVDATTLAGIIARAKNAN